ncbi:integral membrane protein [Asaia spathodeae NBRC 105894]|nr:integral membrane protein [Asaia spathodeae NBRC 105894]
MYAMIAARLYGTRTIPDILDMQVSEWERTRKRGSARVGRSILDAMRREGRTFSEAMSPYAPSNEIMTLASGEQSGNMKLSLDLVREVAGKREKIISSVRTAFAVPCANILMGYCYLYYLGSQIVPKIKSSLPPDTEIDGVTAFTFNAASFAVSGWGAIIPVLVIIAIFGVAYSLPRYIGRYRLLLEALPPWAIYRDLTGYGWIISFMALVDANMSETEALRRQADCASPWLHSRINALLPIMTGKKAKGSLLPEALVATGYNFPSPEMISEIRAVWASPEGSDRLREGLAAWSEKFEAYITGQARIVGFVAQAAVDGMILLFVVSSSNLGNSIAASVSH